MTYKEIDYIIGDKYATPLTDQSKFIENIYQAYLKHLGILPSQGSHLR